MFSRIFNNSVSCIKHHNSLFTNQIHSLSYLNTLNTQSRQRTLFEEPASLNTISKRFIVPGKWRIKYKIKNNRAAMARFIFMKDGTVLRGPCAARNNRISRTSKNKQSKKNRLWKLSNGFALRAKKKLVPYWRKQYIRKWELKSLPLWYREHWQNKEIEKPIPEPFKRVIAC